MTVSLESLVVPSTAEAAKSLAQWLRAALPDVLVVADADTSPIRLVRTMRGQLGAWMADPQTPNRWPLRGIGVAIGGFGALPIPITGHWRSEPANLDRAKALDAAVEASGAPLAVALAGAAAQAIGIVSHRARRTALGSSDHETLRIMLCQVAAHSEREPLVARVAERLLREGFPGAPVELIDTARGIAT